VDPRDPPLAWDYFDGNLQTWRPMRLELDTTGGLNRRGEVIITIPSTSRPVELDRRRASWIRCRVIETRPRQRGYTVSPRVRSVHTQSIGGTVIASHCETISREQLGRSDGTPAQTFTLSSHPILPRRPHETLEVETDEAGVFEPWQEVADFAVSGAADPHFVCDSVSGEVRFGPSVRMPNGDEVQYGAVPRQGRALRFTRYRIGGGTVGNVGAETLTALKTSIPYIAAVSNFEPATGGTEAETLEAALLRGPSLLRSSPRAVTAADFERLAVESTPDVVRAHCEYARLPEDGQAGRVRLVVVPRMPTTDGVVPPEQLALSDDVLRTVQRYLDERRMLTVRLSLEAPQYVAVAVYAVVYVKPGVDQGALQATAERTLYHFIHPTVGGPEGSGWPFGRAVFASDIFGLLSHLADVEYVGTVQFATVNADGNLQPVTGDAVRPPALALLCSGSHRVSVQRMPRG
jgi:predicted phage baseplate assembly protein